MPKNGLLVAREKLVPVSRIAAALAPNVTTVRRSHDLIVIHGYNFCLSAFEQAAAVDSGLTAADVEWVCKVARFYLKLVDSHDILGVWVIAKDLNIYVPYVSRAVFIDFEGDIDDSWLFGELRHWYD